MTELVLSICLAAAPAICREQRVDFTGNAVECALFGQQAAAEWLAQHSKWRLARYRCGPANREI